MQKKPTLGHIIIKMPKIKEDNRRILKAAIEKKLVTYRGVPIRLLVSEKRLCRLEGIGKKYSKSWKSGTYSQDCSTQQSYHLELKGR